MIPANLARLFVSPFEISVEEVVEGQAYPLHSHVEGALRHGLLNKRHSGTPIAQKAEMQSEISDCIDGIRVELHSLLQGGHSCIGMVREPVRDAERVMGAA